MANFKLSTRQSSSRIPEKVTSAYWFMNYPSTPPPVSCPIVQLGSPPENSRAFPSLTMQRGPRPSSTTCTQLLIRNAESQTPHRPAGSAPAFNTPLMPDQL